MSEFGRNVNVNDTERPAQDTSLAFTDDSRTDSLLSKLPWWVSILTVGVLFSIGIALLLNGRPRPPDATAIGLDISKSNEIALRSGAPLVAKHLPKLIGKSTKVDTFGAQIVPLYEGKLTREEMESLRTFLSVLQPPEGEYGTRLLSAGYMLGEWIQNQSGRKLIILITDGIAQMDPIAVGELPKLNLNDVRAAILWATEHNPQIAELLRSYGADVQVCPPGESPRMLAELITGDSNFKRCQRWAGTTFLSISVLLALICALRWALDTRFKEPIAVSGPEIDIEQLRNGVERRKWIGIALRNGRVYGGWTQGKITIANTRPNGHIPNVYVPEPELPAFWFELTPSYGDTAEMRVFCEQPIVVHGKPVGDAKWIKVSNEDQLLLWRHRLTLLIRDSQPQAVDMREV